MLNRQKVLLEILRIAGRPVSKIEMMKWCFLLRMEMPSAGGSAFYEFLPYHYGPYSFALHRDLAELSATGFVKELADTWESSALSAEGGATAGAVVSDALRVVDRYRSTSEWDLTDEVYARHPYFTVNSRRRQLMARPMADIRVYTVGYEGRQIDGLLNLLVSEGIRRLIDVRSNPVARRFGFHKSTLNRLCGHLQLEYVHVPQLGIPSSERRVERSREDLFAEYVAGIVPSHPEAVQQVAGWMSERPSALMCMEALPCDCHRSRLATVIAQRTGLVIRHLGVRDGDN